MSQPLFENLTEISNRLRTASHVFLFLDFDGTLTPIVEQPDKAQLPPETKDILTRLSRQNKISVAIISGRALVDVQARVGIDHLIYAGNHGLEISGPGIHFIHRQALARQEALQQLSAQLAVKLRHLTGVEVEQKGLTTSIHYRRAAAAEVDEVVKTIQALGVEVSSLFRLTTGKMIYEIRPRVDWHKGAAAYWIRAQLGYPNPLSIYLGDDATDENAFVALQQDITVKVGPAYVTTARYHLADPDEVRKFLRYLTLEG
ncbi:MAG: trehalose-phosphatase [bacterium]